MEWKDPSAIHQLHSAPIRVWGWPTFWLSSAQLDSSYDLQFGGRFPVPLYANGWGRTRLASECATQQEVLRLQASRILENENLEWPTHAPQILGNWAIDQLDHGNRGDFQAQEIPKFPERRLLEMDVKTFLRTIDVVHLNQQKKYYVTCAKLDTQQNGIVIAHGTDEKASDAARRALRSLYLRHRRFQNFIAGREQILDRMEDQRLFAFGISKSLRSKFEQAMMSNNTSKNPELTTHSHKGPWGKLHHHSIADLQPSNAGPLERLVI